MTEYEQKQEFIHTLCDMVRNDGLNTLEAVRMYCNEYRVSITYCVDIGLVRTLQRVSNEKRI